MYTPALFSFRRLLLHTDNIAYSSRAFLQCYAAAYYVAVDQLGRDVSLGVHTAL